MIMRLDPARAGMSESSEGARLRERASMLAVEKASDSASSYVDVIERILDKGIVIDAWIQLSLGGIDLITVEACVLVASTDTYLRHWPALDGAATIPKRSPLSDRV